GAMAVCAARPSAITFAAAAIVIGSRQLGLAVLLHEAAHWRLFPRPKANTRAAEWLCAHPLWAELPAYRRHHHQHHRCTRQPDDPDLALAPSLPVARGAFLAAALRDLTGLTWAAAALAARPWRGGPGAAWRRWRGPLAANLIIAGALAA